jgi:hypothetical protein
MKQKLRKILAGSGYGFVTGFSKKVMGSLVP